MTRPPRDQLRQATLECPYGAFVKLLILTGQRRNEVAGLRWRELDLDARTWNLPKERAKNGRENQVPLSDKAVDILLALPRIEDSEFALTLNGRNRISGFVPVKQRIDERMPARRRGRG